MKRFCFAVFILFSLLLASCEQKGYNLKSDRSIAHIDSLSISYSEVDNKIQQQIFDELNRIYSIRSIALEETINQKLLEIEASRAEVQKEYLLDSICRNKSIIFDIEKYIEVANIGSTISEFKGKLVSHDLNSEKGKELLYAGYKDFLIDQYYDSLRNAHSIEINLKPPMPPQLHLKDIILHSKGNLASDVNVLIVSDFDCSMCREYKWVTDSLYEKYGDYVRFDYTHFGSYVSVSQIAAECAANQGKFWEMHEKLYESSIVPDSSMVYRFAYDLNLDMEVFNYDFSTSEIDSSILENYNKIESSGIYGTPTILIDGRPVYDSSGLKGMEDEIDRLLE
jgi:hypothetical protein